MTAPSLRVLVLSSSLVKFQLVQVLTIVQSFSSFFQPVRANYLNGQWSFLEGATPPYCSVPDLLQPAGHPGYLLHELQSESLPVKPI
jgi:hypothetical protein